jgi:hypothetical protein
VLLELFQNRAASVRVTVQDYRFKANLRQEMFQLVLRTNIVSVDDENLVRPHGVSGFSHLFNVSGQGVEPVTHRGHQPHFRFRRRLVKGRDSRWINVASRDDQDQPILLSSALESKKAVYLRPQPIRAEIFSRHKDYDQVRMTKGIVHPYVVAKVARPIREKMGEIVSINRGVATLQPLN